MAFAGNARGMEESEYSRSDDENLLLSHWGRIHRINPSSFVFFERKGKRLLCDLKKNFHLKSRNTFLELTSNNFISIWLAERDETKSHPP